MLFSIQDLIRRAKWYLLVIALTIPTFASLLRPGYFPMHDDLQVMRIYQMELGLKDGQFPVRWVSDMGYRYGYPQYEYYGPLPYYLMTVSRFIGLSLFSAMKFGFIMALVLGNLAMYLLGSSLFGPWGGALSAIAYAYSPYRASDLFSRGAMGETWAFVFLPLIVFSLLRLFKKPDIKSAALLSLSLGGLMVTHNISTLIFSPMIGLMAVFLLFGKKEKKLVVKYGIISIVWAVMIAGSFLLPVIFEKGYAHTGSLIQGYFNYLAHFITLKQLFFTSFWGYGSSEIGPTDDLSFFIGPIHLFIFLSAICLTIYRLIKRKIDQPTKIVFLSAGFIFISLFMTHQKSTFVWQNLPLLSYLQFPWRFLVTANFFISLSVGYLLYKTVGKTILFIILTIIIFLTNVSFFRPRLWLDLTIYEKFSGLNWDRQLTISIFDYLPIYSKLPPAQPAPVYPVATTGKVSFLDFNHQSDSFDFRTKSNERTSLILPQFDFPGWKVWLDGNKIIHHHDNSLGLISFDLPAGEHFVEARLTPTLARLFGDFTSLVFIPLAFYMTVKKEK